MNEITASKIKVFTWWSNNFGGLMMQKPRRKLLDIVRDKIRVKHYSMSTERTYIHWIKHYIFFHNKKHPIEMGKEEIEQFLTFLAVQKKVSPTTQNQAFSAILLLYKEVLGIDMSSWNIQGSMNYGR
jgi:predicted aldo/keto reductase-like oxidoreductase